MPINTNILENNWNIVTVATQCESTSALDVLISTMIVTVVMVIVVIVVMIAIVAMVRVLLWIYM